MEREELIKKLENVKLPEEIELPEYQRKLRRFLLNSEYFKKRTQWLNFRRLVYSGLLATFTLLVFVGATLSFRLFSPPFIEARALKIAKSEPQVLRLIEERGATVVSVGIRDSTAYILFSFQELVPFKEIAGGIPETALVFVRADLNTKRVEILPHHRILLKDIIAIPVTNEDKDKALDIIQKHLGTTNWYQDIEKISIETVPFSFYMITVDNNTIKVASHPEEDKKVYVRIVRKDKSQVVFLVNLTKGEVD